MKRRLGLIFFVGLILALSGGCVGYVRTGAYYDYPYYYDYPRYRYYYDHYYPYGYGYYFQYRRR